MTKSSFCGTIRYHTKWDKDLWRNGMRKKINYKD